MKTTENFGLQLPEMNEFVTPEPFNANFEALDGALAKHAARHAAGGPDPIDPVDLGAASKVHTHDAGDIGSGILPVSRGGTGKGALVGTNGLLKALFPSAMASPTMLAGIGGNWSGNGYVTIKELKAVLDKEEWIKLGSLTLTSVPTYDSNSNGLTYNILPAGGIDMRTVAAFKYSYSGTMSITSDEDGASYISLQSTFGDLYQVTTGGANQTTEASVNDTSYAYRAMRQGVSGGSQRGYLTQFLWNSNAGSYVEKLESSGPADFTNGEPIQVTVYVPWSSERTVAASINMTVTLYYKKVV